jgi:hypothetical protein
VRVSELTVVYTKGSKTMVHLCKSGAEMRRLKMQMNELGRIVKPLYTHDCERCIFLGSTFGSEKDYGGVHDLYFCPGTAEGAWPTIIARYGNEGGEYQSGMIFGYNENSPLWLARERAMDNGLLKLEDSSELRTAYRRWRATIQIPIKPGETGRKEMPWSEVCIHMEIADKAFDFKFDEGGYMVQLYKDGREYAGMITYGEAGIYRNEDGTFYYYEMSAHE